ncbi:tRNA methyltransferase complex GCD14 subunit [Methanococcus vannielii SB]|uniref:tRNA methyltransferase complex GCD14 subunit n=1 Tax=Methanococcus vannielii (strain ATCC 35089 / DSM 1224 / JCM 13029 / OCM 148 / SB) TaxID=406327 RepID=A6UQ19_METVS|nr:tRNA (adenine-N1)-methyltransferase [Methanococcus vannielii]ABR54591.1 tRNA methyltransferase complex GCD14 subunit [Methanococcus vannielii SB]
MNNKRLIIDSREKKYLLNRDVENFGNDMGVVDLKEIDDGSYLTTHKGGEFYVLTPTIHDIVKKMKRTVTTLLPKDIGLIIAECGVENGELIVEAGTGSAALTIYLSNAVGKEGKVVTYEKRPEFAVVARKNLEIVNSVRKNQKITGFEEEIEEGTFEEKGLYNVIQKIGDVTDGIDEENVDVVVLDMPDPWNVVPHAKKALNKAKGRIAIYVPYVEQAKKGVEALKEHGFLDIKTVECIVRDIEISEKGVRPSTRMIGHTGYITTARVCPERKEENKFVKKETLE